jgi:hypothetical protein
VGWTFLERLDAWFAVGHDQHTGLELGLDDIRSKMFDGGRDGQCFNFAGEPSNLMFSGLCAKETSKKQSVVTKGIECRTETIHLHGAVSNNPSRSSGFGITMDLLDESASWAW